MSDLIRLTGLWKSQTKAGGSMLSGSLSPNSRKQKDSEPDYIAFMAPHEKQEQKPDKPQIPGL